MTIASRQLPILTAPDTKPPSRPSPWLNIDNDNNARIRHIFHLTTPPISEPFSPPNEPSPILTPVVDQAPPEPLQPDPVPADVIVEAEQSLIGRKALPPHKIRSKVYQRLLTDTLSALIGGDYDRAGECESAAHYLNAVHERELYQEVREAQDRTIADRLALAHDTLSQKVEEWQQIQAVFLNERETGRAAIAERQIGEQSDFEQMWGDPTALTQFTKSSPQLLLLRKQQKTMALMRDFSGAQEVKATADSLEREEAANAEIRAGEAMRLAFGKLREKHRREIECFDEHQKRIEVFLDDTNGLALGFKLVGFSRSLARSNCLIKFLIGSSAFLLSPSRKTSIRL
jgi:hypothetical protein